MRFLRDKEISFIHKGLGLLIDTFLVRPLLLPSFVILTGRTLAARGKSPAR